MRDTKSHAAIGSIGKAAVAILVVLAALIGFGAMATFNLSSTSSHGIATVITTSTSTVTTTISSATQTSSTVAQASTITTATRAVAQSVTSHQSSTALSSQSSQVGSSPVVILQDLIAGKFPTAIDKQGTNGVTVTVLDLKVLSVRTESDGDWHVYVTDGVEPQFITEITPTYQSSLGKPAVGSTIDETGIAYCDTEHQSEAWHDNTCWEIHPITAWHLSSRSVTASTSQTFASGLNASISYARNPISRGSIQTITVHVVDADGAVQSANVSVHVGYASGKTAKDFACTTSASGSCSVSWLIGGNSNTGTFNVRATVNNITFYSSFQVTTA